MIGESYLTVVFWGITYDISGILDAPEAVGVVADTVENLERYVIFISDVLSLNTFDN